jgi:hypothetical protein
MLRSRPQAAARSEKWMIRAKNTYLYVLTELPGSDSTGGRLSSGHVRRWYAANGKQTRDMWAWRRCPLRPGTHSLSLEPSPAPALPEHWSIVTFHVVREHNYFRKGTEMNRYAALLGGVAILCVITMSVGSWAVGRDSDDDLRHLVTPETCLADAVILSGPVDPTIGGVRIAAPDANEPVYFFPQDTGDTTTVVRVANTTNSRVKVWLFAYDADGLSTVYGWLILGPAETNILCSDNIYTYAIYNTSVWNFATATVYAKLILPPGVVVDGYVVWNSATPYDTDVGAHTVPLRFSAVPAQ